MSEHNRYPVQDLGPEVTFNDPEVITETLHDQELDLTRGIGEVATRTGPYTEVARFEIPSAEGVDNQVTLGYAPGTEDSQMKGFFLLAGQARADYASAPMDWAVQPEQLPLGIGNRVGDTLTVGKNGTEHNGESGNPDSRFSTEVIDAFSGSDTSRKHLTFTVTTNGIKVHDTSMNGTKVTYRK